MLRMLKKKRGKIMPQICLGVNFNITKLYEKKMKTLEIDRGLLSDYPR